jgi:hypothetical protein
MELPACSDTCGIRRHEHPCWLGVIIYVTLCEMYTAWVLKALTKIWSGIAGGSPLNEQEGEG